MASESHTCFRFRWYPLEALRNVQVHRRDAYVGKERLSSAIGALVSSQEQIARVHARQALLSVLTMDASGRSRLLKGTAEAFFVLLQPRVTGFQAGFLPCTRNTAAGWFLRDFTRRLESILEWGCQL